MTRPSKLKLHNTPNWFIRRKWSYF